MLYQQINDDLKAALKEGRVFDLGVLRMISAALKNMSLEKRAKTGSDQLTDEDALAVLSREVKKRKEAAEVYTNGARPELAEKELKEVGVILPYLPAQLDEVKIEQVVKKAIEVVGKDFGAVMREAMKELKGRADGKVVSEIIKKRIG